MTNENSRYASTDILTRVLPDSREVTYYARRFIADAAGFEMAGTVRVQASERSDLIAARAYGDPTTSWRLADGNRAMDFASLTEVPDRILDIPLAKPEEEAT